MNFELLVDGFRSIIEEQIQISLVFGEHLDVLKADLSEVGVQNGSLDRTHLLLLLLGLRFGEDGFEEIHNLDYKKLK